MTTDIARARDTLRDMRAAATRGPWTTQGKGGFDDVVGSGELVALSVEAPDATLIVVLAGNPAFLDAIDGMLAAADKTRPTTEWGDHGLRIYAERIASAIVSGWEKVQR